MIRNLERSVKISLEGPDVNYLSHAIPENLWDRTTQAFFCPPPRPTSQWRWLGPAST